MKTIFFGIILVSTLLANTNSKLLNDSIGYLKFTNGSSLLDQGINDILGKKDLKLLIIDIRDYKGAPLSDILLFLEKIMPNKSLIISLRESSIGPKEFYTNKSPLLNKKTNIIILINKNTASGGEMIAGSIQDWERGIIIGDTSAGKINLLDNNQNITGKVYLPSGRDINRGTAISEYKTVKKRIVFSGCGIAPDINFNSQNDEEIVKKAIEIYNSSLKPTDKERRIK